MLAPKSINISLEQITIMQGKIFFTLFGLLLVQSMLALLQSMSLPLVHMLVEVAISAWFLLVMAIFLFIAFRHHSHAYAMLAFAFIIGLLNTVYLSIINVNSWLIIMLCLSAAGFLLALSYTGQSKRKHTVTSYNRKELLSKELPTEPLPKVEIYHEPTPKKARSVAAKKKSSKKNSSSKKSSRSNTS